MLASVTVISLMLWQVSLSKVVFADNFTDIFYTQSFRGSFEWIQKLDWIGQIIQIVISTFSLFGIALMTIRIMTSFLYLSSKGLWDEVSELKESGNSGGDKDIFGLLGMAKSWVSGKSGTGLDAVFGAVLILLPDVKRYSDFGKHASGKFEADMSTGQYALRIALPTVIATFIFAMGFNGTLWQALAVTVDALGSVADKAVSVDYAGYIDDLVNNGIGYKFTFSTDGTSEGKLKQSIARDIYGKVISKTDNPNQNQLYQIGKSVEGAISELDPFSNTALISESVIALNGSDKAWDYLGYETIVNTSDSAPNATASFPMSQFVEEAGMSTGGDDSSQLYIHLYVKQVTSVDGNFFDTESRANNS